MSIQAKITVESRHEVRPEFLDTTAKNQDPGHDVRGR